MADFFLRNRWLVLLALIALLGGGGYTMFHLNIEAYPDLTNVQVVVTTEAPGMSPVEVEQLVTFPIESTLLGMPNTQVVRSVSKLGLSMITVVFDDSVNIYLARQIVSERLNEVRSRIPQGMEPVLGPLATAFGEVYQFTLAGGKADLMDRKTLLDWNVRYDLRTIPGVSEVNTWGGYTKQYTVEVEPLTLRRYGLSVHDVVQTVADNNSNFGGGFVEHNGEQYTIRGLGRVSGARDLERVVIRAENGTPVLLRDVATVRELPYPRQGAIMHDGKGETVSGMVIITKGTNGRQLISEIKKRVSGMKLPGGVHIHPFYDQSEMIDSTIQTVKHNLLEGSALVVIVLLVFLGNWRAAMVVAAVIPLSLLFGFLGMAAFGVSANLMSLGAVDFGMIVDGSVVMVENTIRRLEQGTDKREETDTKEVVKRAASEVARPITFGVAIIIAVYLPIFTLQGLEGRMFHPMAITVCSALAGSLLLALFAVPTLCSFVLKRSGEEKAGADKRTRWFDRFREAYGRSLDKAFHARRLIVGAALMAVIAAGVSLAFIGSEFMPKLDEGSIVVTSRKLPGISLDESIQLGDQIEKVIRSFPEVTQVVTKLGRPDRATEAMGIEESDSYLTLAPKKQWKCCRNKEDLTDHLSKALNQVPGVAFVFTQPMEMRMDEVVTGIRGDLALKIFGEDLDTLDALAARAMSVLSTVRGAAEVQKDSAMEMAEVRIEVNRPEMDRYGLSVNEVRELVETMLGGKQVSEMVEGERRFGIAVRLPESYRDNLDALGDLFLTAPTGERVQLKQAANLRVVRGPEMVNRENAKRRVAVQASVSGRDLGSFVREAQQKMAKLKLPAGYSLDWGGQFENQQRADKRLAFVLPVSIVIIFSLLYATFRSSRQAFLILMIVPFSLVGGVAALWICGLNLSLSASIGFIALFGVAVLNGVVMVSHIDSLRAGGQKMAEAIREGAKDRFRPVLITASVASLGFIPMALSTSRGAEVQRPLATVVIGGLTTATVLTLYILPILYSWFSVQDEQVRE